MAKRGRPPKNNSHPSDPGSNVAPEPGSKIDPPKKRGRPRKNSTITQNRADAVDWRRRESHPSAARGRRVESSKAIASNDKIKLPHRHPDTFDKIWANAQVLSATITDHYAMTVSEQAEALRFALLLEPGANLVELGVTHGQTAAVLAYAAKLLGFNYFGIDNFTLEGSEVETRANLDRLQLPYTLLVGNTQAVPWHKPVDYLLIDAGHDVRNVTQDTLRWLPLVQPGGLVLYHAYNPSIDQTDPHWGIKNCVDTYCGLWETLSVIPWLIIKRKPAL